LLLVAILATRPAHAQAGATEQAKTFFNAGAQAYQMGQFSAALQAFEEAYRLAPRPGILFSMAQAHRRQYYVDKNAEHLGAAIKRYREYIERVPVGGRRSDAAQALAELEPLAARLGAATADAPAATPAAQQTRVMVSSQTKGARASLDGAAAHQLDDGPLIAEVKPGKHSLRVSADGYFDEVQELNAVEGGLVPRDVTLRERPARVTVSAPDAAEVSVDGRPVGTTPLAAPLELSPGRHFIAVTRTGKRAFSQELELRRGEARTVQATLDVTGQRVVSFAFLGAGALSAAAGVVLTVLTLSEQSDAQAILDKRERSNISPAEQADYDAHVSRRDGFRAGAISGFGAGVVLATVGLTLFAFDHPSAAAPAATPRRDDQPPPPSRPGEGTMEMAAAPMWGPGFAGGVVRGSF